MKEEFDFYSKTSLKSYNLDDRIRYQLKMLDSLDAYTRRHSENVASITCRLCEYLKLDQGFTIYCTTCAYLHDIGKMFIPPEILQKPARLTDEEYEVMKTHTTIGYKMCMNDPKLRPYAAGALYHHEALNGTGYPNGVTANKIPYEAQIIRVADEFEAISAKRQYKTHIGIIDTLNILIDDTKPNPIKSIPDGLKFLAAETRLGKIDRKIVKALFKVVIDDTEYEIAARADYLDYLKDEIKRFEEAFRYYQKMQAAPNESKKEYFREGAAMYLRRNENVDTIPQTLEELKEAYKVRKAHIEKLYLEVKQIKKLVV
ncbi:MAG: HD domain-containing protein [Clostridia bacterium]|nr:HD domain-containing protein [Clostridia bacterium]